MNRVLIIEDDVEIGNVLVDLISDVAEVKFVSTRNQIEDLLKVENFDYILADYYLEKDNSLSIIRDLNISPSKYDILLMSAHPTDKMLEEASVLGIKKFLPKPLKIDFLLKEVSKPRL